jgi:hypothetical protein
MKMKHRAVVSSLAVGSISAALNFCSVPQAQATNLVQNGGFVPTDQSIVSAYLRDGSVLLNGVVPSISVPGWSSSGYNFLYSDGVSASTTGLLTFNSASNQVVNSADSSGWFVGADAAFGQGPISQTLNGLTVGQEYNLTFWQSAGQQKSYGGDTTEQWVVNIGGTFNGSGYIAPNTNVFTGGTTQFSDLMRLDSGANVGSQTTASGPVKTNGWQKQTIRFTATAAMETLNFLAEGTPEGQPPFALLSGVTVEAVSVPEPLTIIGTAIGGTVAFRLKKKNEDAAKSDRH